MKFRLSPLSELRTWINTAIRDKWPWGKILISDLEAFGLRDLWDDYCPRIDDANPASHSVLLGSFKRRVRTVVEMHDSEVNRSALFDAATNREILPWRDIHPACMALPYRYGYMWLRNSFKAPHLLHGRKTGPDVEDDCPNCKLVSGFTPSHLLQCPSFPIAHHLPQPFAIYNNIANRWNLADPVVLRQLLHEVRNRHLKSLSVISALNHLPPQPPL